MDSSELQDQIQKLVHAKLCDKSYPYISIMEDFNGIGFTLYIDECI